MKNKTEYKRLRQKLDTLKEIIRAVNSDALMLSDALTLINISAKTEITLRKENISGNEINSLENKLDCLIKEHLQSNNKKQ